MYGYLVIEGFSDYKVSALGKVSSHKTDQHMKGKLNRENGYVRVRLINDEGKCKHMLVHRLVAKAFLCNPLGLPEVNHKDEDKTNNKVSNLEWCTRQYNVDYYINFKEIK